MADFHGTQEVVTDLREDGVLIMRINRPEKRNAINAVTSAAMEDIMNKAEKDKRVRVIVVTGTGEKAFCAGEDLSELSSGGECMTVTDHGFGGITDRLCPKPTICAVNGVAAGGGMEIAVSCDIVVAAEHARFGLTPNYRVDERSGPDHDPRFTVTVEIRGVKPETGVDRSKRAAEQAAATKILEREGVWPKSQAAD